MFQNWQTGLIYKNVTSYCSTKKKKKNGWAFIDLFAIYYEKYLAMIRIVIYNHYKFQLMLEKYCFQHPKI